MRETEGLSRYHVLWFAMVGMLGLAAISGLIGTYSDYNSQLLSGASEKVLIFGFLLTLTGVAVLWFILLFQYWDLVQHDDVLTTPGKAVGLLFVPIFNIYWVFVAIVGLAEEMNRLANRVGVPSKPNLTSQAKLFYYGVIGAAVLQILANLVGGEALMTIGGIFSLALIVFQVYLFKLFANFAGTLDPEQQVISFGASAPSESHIHATWKKSSLFAAGSFLILVLYTFLPQLITAFSAAADAYYSLGMYKFELFLIGVAVALALAAFAFWLSILRTCWGLIEDGPARMEPGKAVNLMWVPGFNAYWIFQACLGLAQDMNAHAENNGRYEEIIDEDRVRTFSILMVAGVLFAGLSFFPMLEGKMWGMAVVFVAFTTVLLLGVITGRMFANAGWSMAQWA